MKILNKSKLANLMKTKPKAQRIHDAMNNDNWDVLATCEIEEILSILDSEFEDIKTKLKSIISSRL